MTTERKRKRPQKSESLTIRLDPKMRFALEFVARLKGQTITKVIERAISETANSTYSDDNHYKNWLHYWNVNEGIRTIRLAQDKDTNPSFEEEEILDFIETHWNYFSSDPEIKNIKKENIEVLWPYITTLIETWREQKFANREACVVLMRDFLSAAGLTAKSWQVDMVYAGRVVDEDDIDTEIPF